MQKITSPTGICNVLNEYFSNVGRELSEKIPKIANSGINLLKMNQHTIFIEPTNCHEIASIIHKLPLKMEE